jgi:hypothetical protein
MAFFRIALEAGALAAVAAGATTPMGMTAVS